MSVCVQANAWERSGKIHQIQTSGYLIDGSLEHMEGLTCYLIFFLSFTFLTVPGIKLMTACLKTGAYAGRAKSPAPCYFIFIH